MKTKRQGKSRGEVVRKRPPSGRKTGIHDGNLYLTRDLESGEEEVVVCNQGNSGNVGQLVSTQVRDGGRKSPLPPRLLLVSSKIRNSAMLRSALQQNVICVQYRYDSSSLEEILRLVEKGLGQTSVTSVGFVLSCSGSSILLCGKDEKALTRESVQENRPIHDFLQSLLTNHIEADSPLRRLDFLACHAAQTNEGRQIAKEIQSVFNIPVGISREIEGGDICVEICDGDGLKYTVPAGSLYFHVEKVRGWGGHYQQSLAGFEKIRTVGKGAYGAAVLYRKKDDDSLVILKEINMHDLNAAERNLALNEVRVLAMLDHPNIISYYDSFEEDGVIMIEMEYADGGTMSQFLAQQERPLEEKEVLGMFQQIVAAIRHVHEHNILHRDLKTANIFLTKEGVVKVGDFGISKMLSTSNKGANTVLGTPYYISPEMCEGKAYNDRSDIWALGCILYEIACLQKTFEGSNLPALVNKIMKGQFAPVKGNYSQELKQLIADMLLQKPEDRPSANEILYQRLPEMMCRFEEATSDIEDELMSSAESVVKKKRVRSVLYYLATSNLNLSPIELPSRLKIRQVGVGADHVIVVTMERQVYTWGEGSRGQLGHGDEESRHKPQLVDTLKGKSICRACCGDGFSVFGSDNGIVMTCGDGISGCLGHGDWCCALRPRLIEPLLSVDVISLACGPHHVAVAGSAGEIFTWGRGADGRLGLGTEENHCQPVEVIALEDLTVLVREVYCGLDGTMFLTDVGSVYACGNNEHNKLGLNNRQGFLMAMKNIFTKTEVEGKKIPTPVRALGRHRVIDVSMGPNHSAVLVEPGHVYTFGSNTEAQLGTGNTKPSNAPTEVKFLSNSTVNRVQCGEFYTAASTTIDELYLWGLRYTTPLTDPGDSLSSTGGNLTSRGGEEEVRAESVTPRKGEHCRHPSNTSIVSGECPAVAPEGQSSGDTPKCDKGRALSPDRQVSQDSVFSPTAGNGGENGLTQSLPPDASAGFRPLGSAPKRSLSAGSTGKEREKEKDRDMVPEGAERILHPTLILREFFILHSSSVFYCHGENIMVQVETTAPPPARRKSRKKRSFRKRFSRNLMVPADTVQHSASSREGGDEYSSEASEMDSQGPLPLWLKEELANVDDYDDVNDGNEADDTSDVSGDELPVRQCLVDSSVSSIHVNRELKTGQVKHNKKVSPRKERSKIVSITTAAKANTETSSGRGRSLSMNSGGSADQEMLSSSSSSEVLVSGIRAGSNPQKASGIPVRKVTTTTPRKITAESQFKKVSSGNSQKPLSRIRAMGRGRGRVSVPDQPLKEQLTARGFVSDVTVRRREETLQNELEKIKQEKSKSEEKIKEMERLHQKEQEHFRQVALQQAQEREERLNLEIEKLRRELQNQSHQLQNNQKVVAGLQEQLSRFELEQQRQVNSQKNLHSNMSSPRQSVTRDSKVCVIQ
ncbi:serine/threonine-protein kinase Nek9-like [Liolophura sinensis]|uniref:serine/threonine-protein kinase Nek9-like n=1 Tax=Liolophura sinensis TaxID=3198878 RepID=UPI0031582480